MEFDGASAQNSPRLSPEEEETFSRPRTTDASTPSFLSSFLPETVRKIMISKNASPMLLVTLFLVSSGLLAQTPENAFEKDPWPVVKEGPIRVFILAGQSNMQGHASLRTLEYLIYNEETAGEFQHWKNREGGWNERRDVWIWTTDGQRHGNLRPGFGQSAMKIGPELGFGWTVGEALDEQVLIIKTCWGGRSVKKDFLPPGAEQPSDEDLAKELERARKRRPETTLEDIRSNYGKAYRDTVSHVREVLGKLDELFPVGKADREVKLSGLVFFQGWNDLVDGSQRGEKYAGYTRRLGQLVRDIRKDLEAPDLPVVIGELGVGGQPGDFQAAQAAVASLPDLEDRVRFAKTHHLWEPEVEELVKQNVWRGKDWVRFYNVGSDRGYHYLGSAKILHGAGVSFAKSMLELLGAPAKDEAGSGEEL